MKYECIARVMHFFLNDNSKISFKRVATSSFLIIARLVRKKRPSGREDDAEISRQKKENHAILQLALIVGSFAIGYLPNASEKMIIIFNVRKKIKSSLYSRYYAEACNEWGGVHLHSLAPGHYNFEDTSQRCGTVGNSVFDLIGPGIELQVSHTNSDVLSNWAKRPVCRISWLTP